MLTPLQTQDKKIKKMLDVRVRDTGELLRRTVPSQGEPPVAAAYHRMQDVVPAGAQLLVMVDEPFFFDFRRNPILNLDMPGTASPAPGIPCFVGPEPVAEYLLARGIRYVAFVAPERSTFLYRRVVWWDHMYDPNEIWRIYAPYMVNVMDNIASLAKTRVALHEEAGMTVLDLKTLR
jgi:hypothetical protein